MSFSKRLLISVFLFGQLICSGQEKQLFFNHLTVEDGLTQNFTNHIYKDSKGFVWISSNDGLNRFDGQKVKIYKIEEGLPDNVIRSDFVEDEKTNIWFITNSSLVCYIRKYDYFKNFNMPEFSTGNKIIFKSQKNKIGTVYDQKLWFFDIEEEKWDSIIDLPLFFRPDLVKPLFQKNGELKHLVMISKYSSGIFTVSFYPEEIQKSAWRLAANYKDDILIRKVFDLTIERDSIIWATTSKGILEFHIDSNDYYIHKSKFIPPASISFFKKNYLIVSSKGQGLKLFDIKSNRISNQFIHDSNNIYSLSSNNISLLYIDEDNYVWTKSNLSGIDYSSLEKTKFKFIKLKNYLPNSSDSLNITNLLEDKENNIWVSTNGKGIYLLSANFDLLAHYLIEPLNPLKSLNYHIYSNNVIHHFIDSDYWHWVITPKGLYFLKPDESEFQQFPEINYINYGLEGNNGELLFSSTNGLYHIDKKNMKVDFFKLGQAKKTNGYSILFQNNKGLLYISRQTDNLWVLDPQNNFEIIDSFENINGWIRCFYEDKNGSDLWIGTSNGLVNLNQKSKKINRFSKANGLPHNHIHSILPDALGNLWLMTNKGLVKFSLFDSTFHSFQKKDGNQPYVFNPIFSHRISPYPSMIKSNGEYWLKGQDNLIIFQPEKIDLLNTVPHVYLEKVFVNYKELLNPTCSKTGATAINEIKHLRFNSSQNTIGFEFNALEFTDHKKIRYQYKLEGLNERWIDNYQRNNIRFERMLPGNYTLNIRACNSDGVFNYDKPPMTIEFFIDTPFWKTWWFRVGFTMFFIIIFWRIYKYQLEKLLKVERLRNQISTDLHDDIGSTLSNINILTTLIRKKISNKEAAISLLIRIEEEVQSSAESLDDIIWSINPKNDSLIRVLARMRRFASEAFEAKGISGKINFPSDVKGLRLDMEKRRHFYLFFKEAINNLAKYSDCKIATVSIEYTNNLMEMMISDNGKGFDMTTSKERGNGLHTMSQRAKKLKANFDIKSIIGKGTFIRISFKVIEIRSKKTD